MVQDPVGDAQGADTFLGSHARARADSNSAAPRTCATSSAQRQLPGWVFSRLCRQPRLRPHDGRRRAGRRDRAHPCRAISLDQPRARSADQLLTAQVPNPFQALAGHVVQRRDHRATAMLRPFPQFEMSEPRVGWHEPLHPRSSSSRTVHDRLQPAGPRTWSKFTERVFLLNGPTRHTKSACRSSMCRTASRLSGIYELPFDAAGAGVARVRRGGRPRRRMEHPGHRRDADRPADQLPRSQHLLRRRSEQPEGQLSVT